MTGLVQVLIGASILLSLVFVLALGPPRGGVGWMLSAWGWVTVALRVPVPVAEAAVVVLLAQDGVFTWRLVLLWQSRHVRQENGLNEQQSRQE